MVDGLPVYSIARALELYPDAAVEVAMQEKYHAEVCRTLAALGKTPTEVVGLSRMRELLHQEAAEAFRALLPDIAVEDDPLDGSMMRMYAEGCPEVRYKFYPMLGLPLPVDTATAIRRELAQSSWYSHQAEMPKETEQQSLVVGMACSAKDRAMPSGYQLPLYEHPVWGGAALGGAAEWTGWRDDAGANLSRWNRAYAELTVTYWLWKNVRDADVLGLSHYRRHFCLDAPILKKIRTGSVDVVLTCPRFAFPSVQADFVDRGLLDIRPSDYERMLKILERRGERQAAERFFHGQTFCPNNMVIARREIFDRYCTWIFDILETLRRETEAAEGERQDRYLAYAGELLTAFYFWQHRTEWRLAFTDYRLLS